MNPDPIWEETKTFALQWIDRRQGSPRDFLSDLEAHAGWQSRHVVLAVLDELRADKALLTPQRKFLHFTLTPDAVAAALSGGEMPASPHQSSLDDLFARSHRFRSSYKFIQAIEFVSKFREYSPFNNMLVYLQNPLTAYFATASHWHKFFGRSINEEARGMIILAPRTPVLLVYDIADTSGPKLPEKLELFTKTSGRFNPIALDHTVKNCERDKILVERKPMGKLRAGFATARLNDKNFKIRIAIRAELDDSSAYSVLCHELAHVYLGHLGTTRDSWWPYRLNLSNEIAEIEAEAVAYTVCRRAGLETRSAEYLSTYVGEKSNLAAISLDLISRVAGKIEDMGRHLLAPRKQKITSEPFSP